MTILTRTPNSFVDLGTGGFGPFAAWVNPSNAAGSPDSVVATVGGAGSIPNGTRLSGWGFPQPLTAITSIQVRFHGTAPSGAEGLEMNLAWNAARTNVGGLSVGYSGWPQDLASLGWVSVVASLPTLAELASGIFEFYEWGEEQTLQLDAIEMRVDADFPSMVHPIGSALPADFWSK